MQISHLVILNNTMRCITTVCVINYNTVIYIFLKWAVLHTEWVLLFLLPEVYFDGNTECHTPAWLFAHCGFATVTEVKDQTTSSTTAKLLMLMQF